MSPVAKMVLVWLDELHKILAWVGSDMRFRIIVRYGRAAFSAITQSLQSLIYHRYLEIRSTQAILCRYAGQYGQHG